MQFCSSLGQFQPNVFLLHSQVSKNGVELVSVMD